jgi:hypothetical protein
MGPRIAFRIFFVLVLIAASALLGREARRAWRARTLPVTAVVTAMPSRDGVVGAPASSPPCGIDEETARRIFATLKGDTRASRVRYDPFTVVTRDPDFDVERIWPEHPHGRFHMRTNNLGLREDEPTLVEKPTGVVRVLVAGDSHTDGVVDNRDSFPNVLERLLEDDPGVEGRRYEVLNAAVGSHGPGNYLGTLRKFLYLEPDLFVVALFVGNDFADAFQMRTWIHGISIEASLEEDVSRLQAAAERWPDAIAQGLFQAHRFSCRPGWEKEVALEATLAYLLEARMLCLSRGIQLIVVTLPRKESVDEIAEEESTEQRRALGLTKDEALCGELLRDRLAAALATLDFRLVDPSERMISEPAPCYWTQDYHLNLTGHRIVAEVLLPKVRELLGEQ